MNLSKWGGWSALLLAAIYIARIAIQFTILNPSEPTDPLAKSAFVIAHHTSMSAFILVLYTGFGCLLVILALALFERLRIKAAPIAALATIFGIVWATLLIGSGLVYNIGLGAVSDLYRQNPSEAMALLRVVETIHEGLGCMNEIPGGLWLLLSSLAGWQAGFGNRTLHSIGLAAGVSGLLSVIPTFILPAVASYALLSVIWLVWIGVVLQRNATSNPTLSST